jgi:hypothetical protein
MLRQISLLPARASWRRETTRLGAVLQHRLHHLVHLMSSVMRRRRGVMEKLLCKMVFCRRQHALLFATTLGWLRDSGSIGSIEIRLTCRLLSRAGHELGRRLARAVRHQVAGRHQAGHSLSNDIFSHHDMLPTLLAAAGEPDIVEKVKKGHQALRESPTENKDHRPSPMDVRVGARSAGDAG